MTNSQYPGSITLEKQKKENVSMSNKVIKQLFFFLGAWLLVSVAVGGCHCVATTYNVSKPNPVYVKSAPPPAQQDVKPKRPSESHIWVAGAWDWNEVNDEWEWKKGYWVVPPKGYIWIAANYDARGDGTVVYIPGYWEKVEQPKSQAKPSGHTGKKRKAVPRTEKADKDSSGTKVRAPSTPPRPAEPPAAPAASPPAEKPKTAGVQVSSKPG